VLLQGRYQRKLESLRMSGGSRPEMSTLPHPERLGGAQ
jgi:hypothetical protein